MAQQVQVVRMEVSGTLEKLGRKEGTETTQLLSDLLICGLCTTHTDHHRPLKEKAPCIHLHMQVWCCLLFGFLLRYEVNIGPCFAI